MMDILMYLFETYIHSDVNLSIEQDELEDELVRAGFYPQDIYKALQWLEDLALLQQSAEDMPIISTVPSTRVYTLEECIRIDVQCQGFLLFLEHVSVLSVETREMAIDRLMGLETNDLSLDDLKWVVMMVLFNVPGNETAYTLMEELIDNNDSGIIH